MAIEILPLTQDRLPDLAALFGQGGDPRWCWCKWQVGNKSGNLSLFGPPAES